MTAAITPPVRTFTEFAPLLPELVVVLGAFALLMLDLFLDDRRRIVTQTLAVVTMLVAAVFVALGVGGRGVIMEGLFIRDGVADVLKFFALVTAAISLGYYWPYLRERGLYKGEIVVLTLFAVAGVMLLVSAGNLTTLYLGLELLALCSYALVSIDREGTIASEAGIKYFVLGSLASGLLLYGLSLVYGATGTLSLDQIGALAATLTGDDRILLLTGMLFVVAGIAFKFGAVPFHMWLPDTYHGAPTAITVFVSSVPKLAILGMAWRLLDGGMAALHDQWQLLVALLAAASLVLGNLVAVAQTNLKRMLSYSTVSHVGFLFLGIAAGGEEGFAAAMFYAISYAIMSVAAFGAIVMLARNGFEAESIDDFRGLNSRSPWMAALVMLVMASLAGVPPLLGFWAKVTVLGAALHADLLWLVILGIVCAVVGAYYYLRVIKVMYFDPPGGEVVEPRQGGLVRSMFAVNALALLVLGLFWNPIMAWCQQAVAG